jgi:hypothetical protein
MLRRARRIERKKRRRRKRRNININEIDPGQDHRGEESIAVGEIVEAEAEIETGGSG